MKGRNRSEPSIEEENMNRALMIAATALAALCGCSNEPQAPQSLAVAVTAPQEAADKEVLIASQPSQAKVLLKGAEVGATPMKLLIRGDTNVVLEKEGYVRQALMLTQKSDPNVVVTLVPSGEAAASSTEPAAVATAETNAQKSSSEKSSSHKSGEKTAAEGSTTSAQPAAPATEPASAATPPAAAEPAPAATPAAPATPKKTEYSNMRQIKEAYRAGTISRSEYDTWQGIIRKNREAEYEATKKDLRENKITETQYKEKIRAIRAKYEG
jgi:hypothetical protein